MPQYKYDKNLDYQSLIDKAVKAGDLQSAAIYEAQRNAKITGEGLGYDQTNLYSEYLPKVEMNTDYLTGSYGGQIGGLAKDIAGSIGQGFSYDYENDPVYQAMYKQYEADAGKGMEDTLAKVSARTGGLASSYAGQAAQQTYDSTMKQVYSTLIPQLRDQRFQEWQAGLGQQMDLMQMLMGMDDTAYQRGVAAENEEYARQLERAETLAQFGDFSGYEALGYSPEEIANMQKIYQGSLSRGGSGGGGGGRSAEAEIYAAISGMTSEDDVKAYLLNAGLNNWEYNEFLDLWRNRTTGGQSGGAGNPLAGVVLEGSGGNLTYVQGYGNVSYEDALMMSEMGLIEVVGYEVNKDGDIVPIYAPKNKKPGAGMGMTR